MKMIPIKKGIFTLLIIEAVVIAIVTIAFITNLYNIYTKLVYNESAAVLNLYAIITDSKISYIENLSFEILSNQDIQKNLQIYKDFPNSYEAYKATNDLYTQLFSRWIMNKNIISINFVFLDGKRVNVGRSRQINLSNSTLEKIIKASVQAKGSCGWIANAAGKNIVTLYRLIKDISANNKFRALGTLIINIDGSYLLSHTPISKKYKPDIICIAEREMLSQNPINIKSTELLKYINRRENYNIVSLNHKPYFISIKELNYNNWYLIYMLSTRELLSSIYNMNIIYTVTLLMVVIIIIAIGYKLANLISKPITQLTKTMKVIEDGNYSVVLNDQISESSLAITEIVQLSQSFAQMVKKIDHLISEVYVKQLLLMEMKYKMLQQQINPHFLYNTLDTINWKAIQSGNKEISVIVKSLSKLLRGSIKGPDIITIREDLDFVEDYIKIQKIRFEERLEFMVDIPSSVYLCQIPRLTLQPIVENCIIHNLEKYSGICKIYITSSVSEGQLKISVEDTGRGMDLRHVGMVLRGEVETANNSIGLKNIDQRIKMAFGDKFGISVENKEPAGARVTVTLPYEGELYEDTIDS